MSDELILTRVEEGVGIAQLNRPKALNALNRALMTLLMDTLEAFDADRRDWLHDCNWQCQGLCSRRRY